MFHVQTVSTDEHKCKDYAKITLCRFAFSGLFSIVFETWGAPISNTLSRLAGTRKLQSSKDLHNKTKWRKVNETKNMFSLVTFEFFVRMFLLKIPWHAHMFAAFWAANPWKSSERVRKLGSSFGFQEKAALCFDLLFEWPRSKLRLFSTK